MISPAPKPAAAMELLSCANARPMGDSTKSASKPNPYTTRVGAFIEAPYELFELFWNRGWRTRRLCTQWEGMAIAYLVNMSWADQLPGRLHREFQKSKHVKPQYAHEVPIPAHHLNHDAPVLALHGRIVA